MICDSCLSSGTTITEIVPRGEANDAWIAGRVDADTSGVIGHGLIYGGLTIALLTGVDPIGAPTRDAALRLLRAACRICGETTIRGSLSNFGSKAIGGAAGSATD